MGMLALAAGLKGANEAVQPGLNQRHAMLSAQALQLGSQDFAREQADTAAGRARFNIEDERAYTTKREQELYALDRSRKPAEAAEDVQTRKGLLTTTADVNRAEFEAGAPMRKAKDTEEITKSEALSKRKLDIDEQHVKGLNQYYGRAGVQAKDVPDSIKETVAFYSKRIEGLEKRAQDPLTSPEDKAKITKQKDALSRKALSLLGHDEPTEPTAPYTIQSPFPVPGQRTAPASGMMAAPPTAAPPGEPPISEASPNRPTVPRGRVAPQKLSQLKQQQLEYDVTATRRELAQAKIHGNKARIQSLQAQLDALEAQQQAGSELASSQGGR
jgi:hypothetical protein